MRLEDDNLDQLLDKALAEHSQTTARDGLEQRILANLATQEQRRTWTWRWIFVAGTAVAEIFLVILLLEPEPKHQQIANVTAPRIELPAQSPKIAAPAQVKVPSKSFRPAHRSVPAMHGPGRPTASPKLATFPSRVADDELATLAARFAQANPGEAEKLAEEQEKFRQMAVAFTSPISDEE